MTNGWSREEGKESRCYHNRPTNLCRKLQKTILKSPPNPWNYLSRRKIRLRIYSYSNPQGENRWHKTALYVGRLHTSEHCPTNFDFLSIPIGLISANSFPGECVGRYRVGYLIIILPTCVGSTRHDSWPGYGLTGCLWFLFLLLLFVVIVVIAA
jgi:hypothetical protein